MFLCSVCVCVCVCVCFGMNKHVFLCACFIGVCVCVIGFVCLTKTWVLQLTSALLLLTIALKGLARPLHNRNYHPICLSSFYVKICLLSLYVNVCR